MLSLSLSLAALLVGAPTPAKPGADAAALQAEAAAVEKAADSAAAAAAAASKAADAASRAADSAARAAEAAAKAAEKAADAAQKSAAAPPAVAVVAAPDTSQSGNTPVKPPAPPPPDVVYSSVINLGMIALTGNSESLAFNVGGNFQRKGPSWIMGAKGSATYGQTRNPPTVDATTGATVEGATSTNAEAASLQLRLDRRLSEVVSVYLLAGIDTDHIKSIEERPYGEAGASLMWWEVKEGKDKDSEFIKTSLRTDLGLRYGREYRFQYFPVPVDMGEVDIVAPHLGLGFRYAVNKEIIFTEDLDLTANVEGDARLLIVNTAKLAARLTDSVNFAVSFVVNYDSLPPPPKLSTDTALTVGIDIAL